MLLPAVTLDAAMATHEALLRLAHHGYWLDPNAAGASEYLAGYVERIRAASAATATPRSRVPSRAASRLAKNGRPRIDARATPESPSASHPSTRERAPLRADGFDVAAAAKLLARPLDEGRVAIRRQWQTTIYWYSFPLRRVLEQLSESPLGLPVRDALGLHEYQSAPTAQADDVAPSSSEGTAIGFRGIVLRGSDLVGVSEPSDTPRPASRAASVDASYDGGERGAHPTRASAAAGPFSPSPAPTSVRPPEVGSGGMFSRSIPSSDDPAPAIPSPVPARPVEIEAYPHVEAPERVLVGATFDVEIGLGRTAMAITPAATPMRLAATPGAKTIEVEVHVVAEGFDAPNGWRQMLSVSVANPYEQRVVVTLIAQPQQEDVRLTTITVHYAVDGVTCGSMSRRIAVDATPNIISHSDPRGTEWRADQPPPTPITVKAPLAIPDVELNIAKPDANGAKGDYVCTMRNAHGIPVPDAPIRISLGDDAPTYAKSIIDEIRQWDGDALVENLLAGHGESIAAKLPDEFWTMLRAVAATVNAKCEQRGESARAITLQLNSAEPYVPWELATMNPPLDPTRPPALAAQVAMGRWILGDASVASPPRTNIAVKSMAVMAGMYNAAVSGLRRLPKAEAEVNELEQRYSGTLRATRYDCDPVGLKSLLDAKNGGGAEAVHFAGHGQVDPNHPGEAALFLSNGKPLSPIFFRKTQLGERHAPFVFLNACMVGAAGEMLGDFGGFPGAMLAGNVTALVAPLWAVNDDIAHWVATTFYEQTLDAPHRPVAEVLRDIRDQYEDHPDSSSYLAYVYYGNPCLTLTV